jgi:hypothetical protein
MASYICIKDCYLSACDDRRHPVSAFSIIKGTVVELKGGYAFNEVTDRITQGNSGEKYYQYNYGNKRYYFTEKTVKEFFRIAVHKHLEAKTFVDEKSLNEFLSNIDGDKVKSITPVITGKQCLVVLCTV